MLRVLIVDDEIVLAYALCRQLEARGCTALRPAADGESGLASCCAERPDVVLMDIRMPRMDGLETTRRIMAECPTCVIVVTAFGDDETASQATAAGAMAYLSKPVGAEEILEAVGPALARFAEWRQGIGSRE